jgi:hypothetical protein
MARPGALEIPLAGDLSDRAWRLVANIHLERLSILDRAAERIRSAGRH